MLLPTVRAESIVDKVKQTAQETKDAMVHKTDEIKQTVRTHGSTIHAMASCWALIAKAAPPAKATASSLSIGLRAKLSTFRFLSNTS